MKEKKTHLTQYPFSNRSMPFFTLSMIILLVVSLCFFNLPARVSAEPQKPYLWFWLQLPGIGPPPWGKLMLYLSDGTTFEWLAGSGIANDPRDAPQRDYGPIPPWKWKVYPEEADPPQLPGHWLAYPLSSKDRDHPPYDRNFTKGSFFIHGDDNYSTKGCIGLYATKDNGYIDEDYWNFSTTLESIQEVQDAITAGTFFLYVDYDIYDVTITTYCYSEGEEVSVFLYTSFAGSFFTPWSSYGPEYLHSLTGTNSFEVEYADWFGHQFNRWSTGSTDLSMTITSSGTYKQYKFTAYYGESSAVGGVIISVDKLGLLAPYIGLASTILIATVATSIYTKHIKRRKEKQ